MYCSIAGPFSLFTLSFYDNHETNNAIFKGHNWILKKLHLHKPHHIFILGIIATNRQ